VQDFPSGVFAFHTIIESSSLPIIPSRRFADVVCEVVARFTPTSSAPPSGLLSRVEIRSATRWLFTNA